MCGLQPIGLCYLKAAVAKHLPGIDVIVRDYHGGASRRTVPIPKELRYLSDYYGVADKSPFSTFHRYYHFGQPFDAIEAEIALLKPRCRRHLLAVHAVLPRGPRSCGAGEEGFATPSSSWAALTPRRCRSRCWHRPMSITSFAAKARNLLSSFCAVCKIIGPSKPSPTSHTSGKVNLSSIRSQTTFPSKNCRIPDLSDLTPQTYTLAGKPMTFMITSRSCPHKCSFCSVHTTFGTDYRRRSLEQVLQEIELRYRQGYRVIDFEDDNLTYYKQTFKELCRRLIARFPDREMQFVAMNGISYLSLDDELLELMRQAGFSHLNLALVSSDKTVRETTKRPHTLEAYVKVVAKAHALGFKIVSYQILGLPNESLDSMIQTLAFNARLPVLLGASPFYQTPNSPIARGLDLTEGDFIKARLTALAIETERFKRDDIYTLFVTTRILNFLKGLPIDGHAALPDLMNRDWFDPRTQIGFDLLKQLSETGRLCFSTAHGLVENGRFRVELFARVLHETGTIRCQDDATISVDEFSQSLLTRTMQQSPTGFREHLHPDNFTANHIL